MDFTNLDPQVVTLAKAIRHVESNGDFNAVGDGGDSHGAYQFNKGNFAHWASQFGLDPNDFSPINQDKVAYAKMKAWKDQGYHAGEIAAMWNGSHLENGRPMANNPQYITKVQQALGQTNGQSNGQLNPNQQNTQTPQGPGYLPMAPVPAVNANYQVPPTQSLGQQAGGIGGKVVNTTADVLGVKKAGQGIATAINTASGFGNTAGDLTGADLNDTVKINTLIHQYNEQLRSGNLPLAQQAFIQKKKDNLVRLTRQHAGMQDVTQGDIDEGTKLSNKEVLGSFGNVALDVLSAGSLPGEGAASGVLSKGEPLAETLAKGTGLTGKALKVATLGARTAEGGLLGYGFDVAGKANNNQDNISKPGLGTAAGALLPGLLSGAGKVTRSVVSKLSGVDQQVIQRAVENPEAISKAVSQYAKNPGAERNLVETASDALGKFAEQRSQEYGDAVSRLASDQPIPKGLVTDSFSQEVQKFGGRINENGDLVFSNSKLTSTDKSNLTRAWDDIKTWTNVTPQGFDDLRQNIGNYMKDYKVSGNPRANVVLGNVKDSLTNFMTEHIPGYSDMLSHYGEQSDVIKNIAQELQLSGQAKDSTKLNNIMKIFRKDPVLLENLTKAMGEQGANKFLNDASGAILTNWMPQGKLGNLLRTGLDLGGGILGVTTHNPYLGVGAGVSALASSPRIVGKAATTSGKLIQNGGGGLLRRLMSEVAANKLQK